MALRPALDLDALMQGTPFRAIARIGAGGMGEIYEALGPFGGERVVVKILRAELVDQAELVERFRREAEVLQFLSHPNIVVSHGHGTTAAGRPYVVLERLQGSTLRQELARRCCIPVGEAVAYTRQLLSALVAVHDTGVVHRDVKPGNVMLCPAARGGRIKLIDFGVAKVESDARRLVGPITFPTREGICLGTPRYVSPEQATGVDVDRRTDIYAAGLLLYTLIAGRGPFDDIVGVQRVLEAHIGHEPPPPSRFMAVPVAASIEAVILRAIAKNPAERFDDVASFRRALARAWAKERAARRRATSNGRARGERDARRPSSDRGSYAHRPASDRCRIRAYTTAAPSAVDGAFSSGVPVQVHDTDTVTVLWSGAPQPARAARAPIAPEVPVADGTSGAAEMPPLLAHSRRKVAPISRRGVFCSAAAFFAVAGGLAMWFVR